MSRSGSRQRVAHPESSMGVVSTRLDIPAQAAVFVIPAQAAVFIIPAQAGIQFVILRCYPRDLARNRLATGAGYSSRSHAVSHSTLLTFTL